MGLPADDSSARWWCRGSVQAGWAAGLTGICLTVVLTPWAFDTAYVFPAGTDSVWQQAILQLHGQGGVFGTSDHLAWPVGASPWRLPQLGAAIGLWAWISVGWFSMGTASATLWYLVLVGMANAASMVYLLRSWGAVPPVLVIGLATTLPASVFFVTHQLNLVSVYPVALVLAVLVRIPTMSRRQRWWALGGTTAVCFAAPLWWIVVLTLMLPFVLLAALARRWWRDALTGAMVMGAVMLGGGLQTLVFLIAQRGGPGSDRARTPWLSNYFPGHFTDLFIAAPSVRRVAPGVFERLREGASVDLSMGVPVIITAAVALAVLLALPPRRLGGPSGPEVWVLASATIVSALFWLGGGLGNFQAAVAVLAGTVSPARIWYRMLVILAILGAAWIAAIAASRRTPSDDRTTVDRVWPVALVVALGVGAVADLAIHDRNLYGRPDAAQPDRAVIDTLRAATDPCIVAQFPDEAIPNGLITTGIFDPLTYRGMIPYIIAPEYRWTAGSLDVDDRRGLATLPAVVTERDFAQLEEWGFCAVLYDRRLGAAAADQGVDLSGVTIDVERLPDHEDPAHLLFLLGD